MPETQEKEPFLALCMIIKDEEANIQRLLDSITPPVGAKRPYYDEIVIVDTGSTDRTREIVAKHFGMIWEVPEPEVNGINNTRKMFPVDGVPQQTVILANFKWVKDFQKARQFSFELASARWRMYLDADDTFDPKNLRALLETMEAQVPVANVVSMEYVYTADDTVQPDQVRCVRWKDYMWYRRLHECLVPRQGKARFVAKSFKSHQFKVFHHKTPEGNDLALERNHEIAMLGYQEATDPVEKAQMAYFCSVLLKTKPETVPEALRFLDEAWEGCRGNNFGVYARYDAAKILIENGKYDAALRYASDIEAFSPEYKEGQFLLGVIHTKKKDYARAAMAFDTARARENVPLSNMDEIWFSQGLVNACAALAYFHVGRVVEASECLLKVREKMRRHEHIIATFTEAQRAVAKATGLQRLMDYVEYLEWDTEAPKAVELLSSDLLPAAISNHPQIAQKRRQLLGKLKHHYGTWQDYKDAYASIPDHVYHSTEHDLKWIRKASRYVFDMQAAEGQNDRAKNEGRKAHMLSIGFQDGNIERDILEKCENIILTVADVAPQASVGLRMLEAAFPGRVNVHAIEKDAFDWIPKNEDGTPAIGKFDLVTLMEVIEHVPGKDGDVRALRTLRKAVVPETGTILVSTPVADRWVESGIADPHTGQPWYGHVRAHNSESLKALFDGLGLIGTIVEGWDGTYVCDMQYRPTYASSSKPSMDVAIVIPGTPKPFDAFGHLRGFTGGSEEAVIYLAEGLAKLGHTVTVYTPEYRPDDGNFIRAHMGVLWRDINEMDFFGGKHETVLFWRCPEVVSQVKDAPYRKVLWLHDYEYNAPPEAYKAADVVVVLSESHAKSIAACDGFEGPFFKAANGIDPSQFPPLVSQVQVKIGDQVFSAEKANGRDPNKVIYMSSPDRGLHRLLEEWEAIKAEVPEATLDIYYDWTQFAKIQPEFHAQMVERVAALGGLGVRHLGGVDQPTLHEAMRKANVWAYANTGRIETFCITAVKAQACGLTCITTDAGALEEVVLLPPGMLNSAEQFIWEEDIDKEEGRAEFRDRIISALKNPEAESVREERRKRVLEKFSWDAVSKMFEEVL